MIEIYKRLAQRCRSINQLNAVHIALENRLTPLEFMNLWLVLCEGRFAWFRRAANGLLGRSAKNVVSKEIVKLTWLADADTPKIWVRKLRRQVAFSGKKNPEPFVRCRLRHGVWIYEGDRCRKQKTLLVCFSGGRQRMMMPMPVFLQHFDAKATDIVYLRTDKHCGYRSGIRGLADSLTSSIGALERLLRVSEYDRVATMGTSGGGLPAIFAGLQLGSDAVLSIGPNNPNDIRWANFMNARKAADLFRNFVGAGSKLPEIHLVYGSDSRKDAMAVEAIASCIRVCSIREVPVARHNALFPSVERGEFRDLLRSTVSV